MIVKSEFSLINKRTVLESDSRRPNDSGHRNAKCYKDFYARDAIARDLKPLSKGTLPYSPPFHFDYGTRNKANP